MGHVRSHDLDGTSSVSSPTVSGAGLRMWLPGFQKTGKSSPATEVIWDYILQKGWQTLVCFPFPDLVLVTGLASNATLGFISLKSSILTHLVFKADPHLILQLQKIGKYVRPKSGLSTVHVRYVLLTEMIEMEMSIYSTPGYPRVDGKRAGHPEFGQ